MAARKLSGNSILLQSFADYCKQHPTERFWQALRNWSGYPFIYGSNLNAGAMKNPETELEDTFYKEDN